MPDYIALAIPFFFASIFVELVLAKKRGRSVYRLSDALTDISCGITSQLSAISIGTLQLVLYAFLYEQHRFWTLEPTWLAWTLAFVGVDLAYYVWHRASHEVNVLWAAHIVHHQSEDFNLAVALRQAVLTSWTSLPFYAPLALIGVPPVAFLTARAASTLYQFWIHTQLLRARRGPLHYVLNLPAHHRVHHAINPRYLDKNFGATLIVWDRWLGTFAAETEPPVYGITKPLASLNPLWAQVHYWVELARTSVRAPRVRDKLRVWLASPAFTPAGLPDEPYGSDLHDAPPKYDVPLSKRLSIYLVAQYALVVLAATALIFYAKTLPPPFVWAAAILLFSSLVSFGGLMERRRWAWPLEIARALGALVLAVTLLA